VDFTGARDDGVALASAGPYANHLHLAPDRLPRPYLTTQFFQAGCPSCHPTNSVETLKAEDSHYLLPKLNCKNMFYSISAVRASNFMAVT